MIRRVSISDAKSHLSELVGRMMYAGDHIVIERHGKSVVVMVPMEDYQDYQNAMRSKQQFAPVEHPENVLPGLQ